MPSNRETAEEMADMEKIHDASSDDPEKRIDASPKATSFEDIETKDVTFIHADPSDGDEALKAFEGQEVIVMTEEMERKLLRKIDWNLMPVCLLGLSRQPHGN